MKLALLLPGYVDSPDYLDMLIFEKRLKSIGYTVKRVDLCGLWKTGNSNNYNLTNCLKSVKDIIDFYNSQNPEEVVVIGHSFGGAVAVMAGYKYPQVTKVIGLCPALSFDNSNLKWDESSIRHSKRDLPNNPSEFREFDIPISFVEDRNNYSMSDALKNLQKPLMVLIGMKDEKVLPIDTENALKDANNPYVVRMENMGHDFRRSESDSNQVADQIEKFLSM